MRYYVPDPFVAFNNRWGSLGGGGGGPYPLFPDDKEASWVLVCTMRNNQNGDVISQVLTHPIHTPPVGTPYQHTLSTHPINTPYPHPSPTHVPPFPLYHVLSPGNGVPGV